MRFIGSVIERLQREPKRAVFPEGVEPRILQAARQYQSLRLGTPILLGDRVDVKRAADQINVPLDGIQIVNPEDSRHYDTFSKAYHDLRKSKGLTEQEARRHIAQPSYFGAMLVASGEADSFIAGVSDYAESVLRPLFRIFKVLPHRKAASSCMILELEDAHLGAEGVLFLADCGVIPKPSEEELAHIAVSTAELAGLLTQETPRVALLSYSTKGSACTASAQTVRTATRLATELAADLGVDGEFDGELQVDTALSLKIAERKLPESAVAGRAGVLIFPDLNAGNIASKIVQLIGRANAYGQIILGLDGAAADVSRGSSSHDILGVSAVAGLVADVLKTNASSRP